ncbi:porin family protein [Aliivibrio sifiae]
MSVLSLIRAPLCAALGIGVVLSASAEPYIHGVVGIGEESTMQWGGGTGVDFDESPWGVEANIYTSGHIIKENNSLRQQWVSLSGTYRINDLFLKNLTIKGGLGFASIYRNENGKDFSNNDFSLAVTPNIEFAYRLSSHWDVFAGYRYFFAESLSGGDYSSNAFSLGARLYWSRSEPALSVLNYDDMSPAMTELRNTTLAQSEQTEVALDGYGITSKFNQFFVENKGATIAWDALTLIIDGKETAEIPLNAQIGRLEQRFPRGLHTVTFILKGKDSVTDELQTLEASRSIRLYHTQGMNFLLSVERHFMGDSLDVQAF